jgi:hypothetical protein
VGRRNYTKKNARLIDNRDKRQRKKATRRNGRKKSFWKWVSGK